MIKRAGENVSASAEDLIDWCRQRLSKFKAPEQVKVPELIEFGASLPRTSVGKIQKHLF